MLALTSLASLAVLATATSYARDTGSHYLKTRNDLGLVAFCTSKGLLPSNAERFFKFHIGDFHRKFPPAPGGDLHESKGREGISYLLGDEQPLEELAAANGVELADMCHEYRNEIFMGELISKKQPVK